MIVLVVRCLNLGKGVVGCQPIELCVSSSPTMKDPALGTMDITKKGQKAFLACHNGHVKTILLRGKRKSGSR